MFLDKKNENFKRLMMNFDNFLKDYGSFGIFKKEYFEKESL